MYVSCNRSRCPYYISTGFVGLVAYHLLRHALNQPGSIQEMENIRKSCVGNGSLQRRHPIPASKDSIIRLSEGIYSHIHKTQGNLSLREDVPYTSPTPCILSWKQEPTAHFHQAPTSLTNLHHGTSHRCRSPLLAYPDRTRQSSPPTSERKGRSHERRYPVLHPCPSGQRAGSLYLPFNAVEKKHEF